MLLTVEYNQNGVVEIFMDEQGREILLSSISRLSLDNTNIDHDHLMTPSWAGTELTEEVQDDSNLLVNKLNIILVK